MRIAHEILERHRGVDGLVLVGIQTRGLPLACRIGKWIQEFEGIGVPVGALNTRPYRDDVPLKPRSPAGPGSFPLDINRRNVVLVDDVLFAGRTPGLPWMPSPTWEGQSGYSWRFWWTGATGSFR